MWHMHQPFYQDAVNHEYRLPWVYLHAIKDYSDMAWHLEAAPRAHAVINFAPILLEQIDDYVQQLESYFLENKALRDPLLNSLVLKSFPRDPQVRSKLVKSCLCAHEVRLVMRYTPFAQLVEIARQVLKDGPTASLYLDDQFIADMLVWFHIAWLGESVKSNNKTIAGLIKKERNYSAEDRHQLLCVINDIMQSIIPRYRALAERDQIELSMSPYAHPILPLLLDIESAHEAMPEVPLPANTVYPDGLSRCRWQIEEGRRVFKHYFHTEPAGCWPSEGSISEATVALLQESGFRWLASGENVLRNSLQKINNNPDEAHIHQTFKLNAEEPACFFRDDGLSDQIGFTYADWHADDAVANMVHHLENIAEACKDQGDAIVSIILDGENAWEHYPENGVHFLKALYEVLTNNEQINLTTYSRFLDKHKGFHTLPNIVAGSWVYGTFSTWIGEADKNRGWEELLAAKRVYDQHWQSQPAAQHAALARQLAICEGSDWFWWFGDYNGEDSVRDFDELYREQLTALYHMLNQPVPESLSRVISRGKGAPEVGGAMRRGSK